MRTTLQSLVKSIGMAAVLATLSQLIAAEASDLEDAGDPADALALAGLEEVASQVLAAAAAYESITPVG